jgi:hypothetical protein
MIDFHLYIQAALELGHEAPVSVEEDGTVWLGENDDRKYLTATQLKAVKQKVEQIKQNKKDAKQAIYDKLGLTADEVAALLS